MKLTVVEAGPKELSGSDCILQDSGVKLLVMPGGADSLYHQYLKESGCDNIRKFVEEGGTYIGICAGAYFGCSKIEFEKGLPNEIIADRALRFFEGTAVGAALRPYPSGGAIYTEVAYGDKGRVMVSYNGGCTFNPGSRATSSDSKIEVLARYVDRCRYLDESMSPAVIKCTVGKGFAILSGVHFERGSSTDSLEQFRKFLLNDHCGTWFCKS
jgi:biotin--protein ligase